MRFRVYDRLKDDNRVDFYGSGCEKPIEFKIEALKDYMFSIVIENSIESDYFTEKILDCFLSGTIPVYVGSKTTSQYFDENGIIYFPVEDFIYKKQSNKAHLPKIFILVQAYILSISSESSIRTQFLDSEQISSRTSSVEIIVF